MRHTNRYDRPLKNLTANLNRGGLNDHRILKESTYDLIWKASQFGIGLSRSLDDHKARRVARHNGQDDGFQATVRLVPARKICVTIVANSDRSPTAAVAEKALRVALDEE